MYAVVPSTESRRVKAGNNEEKAFEATPERFDWIQMYYQLMFSFRRSSLAMNCERRESCLVGIPCAGGYYDRGGDGILQIMYYPIHSLHFGNLGLIYLP